MPNRIIKESICYSEDLDQLTPFEETAFYRLMVRVDDYGRCDARPAFLRSMLFSTKPDVTVQMVAEAVDSLARVGVIRLYEVGGRRYLYFPNWCKHQRIRNSKEKYPAPPEGDAQGDERTPDVFADDASEDDGTSDQEDGDSCPVDDSRQAAPTRDKSRRVAASCGETPQTAAGSSNAPHNAAYTRAGAESESESRIRIRNPNSNPESESERRKKNWTNQADNQARAPAREESTIAGFRNGLRRSASGQLDLTPGGKLIAPVKIACDDNWRYSERARMATAQLVVDEIRARRLPAMQESRVFDDVVDALAAKITPEVIVGIACDCNKPGDFNATVNTVILALRQREKVDKARKSAIAN